MSYSRAVVSDQEYINNYFDLLEEMSQKFLPQNIFVLGQNNLTYLLKFIVHCCKFLSYQIEMADSNRANLEECSKLTNNTYSNTRMQ